MLPHLPELPARGPGADMIGRGAAFLPDLFVDLQPAGWRFVPRPGLDSRRALDHLARDLDAVEQAFAGYAGPFKVQVAGAWTLAANVELHRGDKALADPGAVRDIAAALAEGVAAHVADVRRRIPGADVVVQVDEPSLPAVAHGRVRTASGFGTLRRVDRQELLDVLHCVPGAGIHCCAGGLPVHAFAGAAFVSLDLAMVDPRMYDVLGTMVENGTALFAGTTDATALRALISALGANLLRGRLVVTPPCGLASSSPDAARETMGRVRELARRAAEEDE